MARLVGQARKKGYGIIYLLGRGDKVGSSSSSMLRTLLGEEEEEEEECVRRSEKSRGGREPRRSIRHTGC